MTGIERLRALAYKKNYLEPAEARELDAIADQIEREQTDELLWRLIVVQNVVDRMRGVCSDPCSSCSVTSGFVLSWARDLEEALGRRDTAADVSMSAYDLLPQEDREAIAWVREHGGLERVKAQRREFMPRSAYERKKAGFLDHIAECERALRRRNERIKELNRRACDLTRENAELRKRSMPEGMEWPRYESGEPVRPSDKLLDKDGDWFKAVSFVFTCDWWSVRGYKTEGFGDLNDETRRKLEGMAYGTCVKRLEPKVLDADGVEIRVGDRVWSTQLDEPHEWIVIDPHEDRDDSQTVLVSIGDRTGHARPENLTHRAPVLAADGRPLREGETVYKLDDDRPYTLKRFDGDHVYINAGGSPFDIWTFPNKLTHERPDSWERIEEDARSCTCVMEAIDLVRRARALAERERGE